MPALEAYKRELDYSYAPGLFPSLEAMTKRPQLVRRLLVSSRGQDSEGVKKLIALAEEKHIRIETADKALSRISGKDNCFAAAVFEKQPLSLNRAQDHIVLHHISDQGNLGTILRTALGFGYHDIAIIRPAADVYDPKVARASMGALFSLRVTEYGDFSDYWQDLGPARRTPSCWTAPCRWMTRQKTLRTPAP
jgi:TrmH family RNA methyltransferase